jgi:hypothetical protein
MSNPNDPAQGATTAVNRNRATQPIPILAESAGVPPPELEAERTAALELRPAGIPEPAADAQTRALRRNELVAAAVKAQMAAAEAKLQAPPPRRSKALAYWIGGVVAVLILAGAAGSYLLTRPVLPAPGAAENPAGQPPPPLRAYYDRANSGDVNAMRMLGTMYYNGLNVPQDQKEGIRWYRKAAAAGSVAAAKDLEQLGLSPAQ